MIWWGWSRKYSSTRSQWESRIDQIFGNNFWPPRPLTPSLLHHLQESLFPFWLVFCLWKFHQILRFIITLTTSTSQAQYYVLKHSLRIAGFDEHTTFWTFLYEQPILSCSKVLRGSNLVRWCFWRNWTILALLECLLHEHSFLPPLKSCPADLS